MRKQRVLRLWVIICPSLLCMILLVACAPPDDSDNSAEWDYGELDVEDGDPVGEGVPEQEEDAPGETIAEEEEAQPAE